MKFAWQATVQDDAGNAVPLPVVTVYEGDGVTLAAIYAEDEVTPLDNPMTGTLEGFVQFWADAGKYRIEGDDGSETTRVWVVSLGDSCFVDSVLSMLSDPSVGYSRFRAGSYIRDRENNFSWLVQPVISTDYQIMHPITGLRLKVMRPDTGYSVAQWGVRPQQIADTALMQSAIDFALDSGELNLHIPAEHYVFSQLRGYNPSGSERAKRGKLCLYGDGQLGETETYRGEEVSAFYGTILEIQPDDPNDSGIILASGDTLQRDSTLRDLTVIYGGNGYAVDARYIPFVGFDRVSIRLTSPMAGAVDFSDNWGAVVDHCYFLCAHGIVSSAKGVQLGRTIFAGNFVFRDSWIENFYDNVFVPDGASFTNIVFENCPIQKFRRNGIRCEGVLWNLKIRDGYKESTGGLEDAAPTVGASSHLYVSPATGSVANLVWDGGFMLGGTETQAWTTAPFMDLTNVKQASIRDITVFRPWQPLIRLNSACKLTIDGIDVNHDGAANLPTGPLDMIVRNGSFYCNVELKRATITSSAKLRWCDPASVAMSEHDGEGLHTRRELSVGLLPVTIGLGAAYDMSAANPRPIAILVTAILGTPGAAPVAVRLPLASTRRGHDFRFIHNPSTNTQSILVRNGPGATNIATIPPGNSGQCFCDPVNDKWGVNITPLGYGP